MSQHQIHAPQKKQLPPKSKPQQSEKQNSQHQNETRDVRPVDPREVIDLESDMDYDRF